MLAEGRRSRLVQHLREELQIVESIDMDLTVLEQGSLVMLEACCPPDLVEQVEQEVQIVLAAVAAEPIHANELERARQLVGNGLRFSLEAPGAVAGIAGAQTLWGHSKSLLEPLIHLDHWEPETLRTSVFSQLQTEQAFTLVALPGDED